jgi:hypothetical protein
MSIGEEATVTIQPGCAYGAEGAGDFIPPNSLLRFEVFNHDSNCLDAIAFFCNCVVNSNTSMYNIIYTT